MLIERFVSLKSIVCRGALIASIFPVAAIGSAWAGDPAPATLPGGATSIQETFSDWQVSCVVQGPAKRCVLAQDQTNPQSHQRVIAIELTNAADKIEGVLLMPFGLNLDRGVSLQVDDQTAGATLKFRTCVPAGCLVPLSFDAKTSQSLRGGTVLKIRATADNEQAQAYSISLKGFAPAADRVAVLAK